MAHHRLEAGPDTVHWGYFESSLPPQLIIDSGDTVTLSTVSGAEDLMPPREIADKPPFIVPKALRDIHTSAKRRMVPGHMCTGPIAVRGAKPGHVLQVDIEKVELNYDWGYNNIYPLRGGLPDDFDEPRLIHIPLDRQRMVGRLPWGMEVPLRPFFGLLATAPPKAWGTLSTIPPRRNGGNIDNKELVAGSRIYLPVFVDDALLSIGDGHGAQGDGEICLSAIETGLIGTFKVTLRQDMKLMWPMAETPTHVITMGFDPDLDDCVEIALRQMLEVICARTGIDRHSAHTLMSLAADLRITQIVNGNKGVHLMLEKRYLERT